MRRLLMMTLTAAAAVAVPVLPVQAATVLVGTFDGNQCKGGDVTTCYATGTTAGGGLLTQVGPHGTPVSGGSPGILALDNTGATTGFTDSLSTVSGHTILNYSYTGSDLATYFGIFQGGSAVGCSGQGCFNNTYLLFYNPAGFTSGTFDLTALFNNAGVSHVDLFDHGGSVPEPASWAMMLLGFGGIGFAMRRSRRNLPLPRTA
jgi:PEP-CTERM motif